MLSLSALRDGEKAVIVSINTHGRLKRRLLDMGIVPGTEVTLVRRAPIGDPIEFYVLGYRLGLRKKDAENILCEQGSSVRE